jgi:hypothetical protein
MLPGVAYVEIGDEKATYSRAEETYVAPSAMNSRYVSPLKSVYDGVVKVACAYSWEFRAQLPVAGSSVFDKPHVGPE